MARYGKLIAKEGEANVFVISNVIEASGGLASDYILLPENPPYGIGDEYNSSSETFTSVPNKIEDAAYFTEENETRFQELLAESDWAVLPDSGLTATCLQEWKTYRAQLRAIRTNPPTDTSEIAPDKPAIVYED